VLDGGKQRDYVLIQFGISSIAVARVSKEFDLCRGRAHSTG
jgi:hypothetical protein